MSQWQEELRHSVRTAAQLRRVVGPAEAGPELDAVLETYKMAIPPYYLGLINWEDPHDPIRLQALAAPGELVTAPRSATTR